MRNNTENIMDFCKGLSNGSMCMRTKVGAMIIGADDYVVVSTNGGNLCTETNCLRKEVKSGEHLENCRGVHAEVACILDAVSKGKAKGSTLYSTHSPCGECARLIAYVGIKEVVYITPYANSDIPFKILEEAGVKVTKFNVEKRG